MIKAVFFDIDGTLVHAKTKIMPPSTRDSLPLLREKGLKLFVATGRPPQSTLFLKQYFDFDAIVSFTGAYAADADGRVYHDIPFSPDVLNRFYAYAETEGLALMVETAERQMFSKMNDRIEKVARALLTASVPVGDIRAVSEPVYQIIAYLTEDEEAKIRRLFPELTTNRLNEYATDITQKGVTKRTGVLKTCERFGFSPDEAMAFGDGENDVPMLAAVGVGIAVGNACENAVRAAKDVTADIENDGIRQALVKYGVL